MPNRGGAVNCIRSRVRRPLRGNSARSSAHAHFHPHTHSYRRSPPARPVSFSSIAIMSCLLHVSWRCARWVSATPPRLCTSSLLRARAASCEIRRREGTARAQHVTDGVTTTTTTAPHTRAAYETIATRNGEVPASRVMHVACPTGGWPSAQWGHWGSRFRACRSCESDWRARPRMCSDAWTHRGSLPNVVHAVLYVHFRPPLSSHLPSSRSRSSSPFVALARSLARHGRRREHARRADLHRRNAPRHTGEADRRR